MSQSEAWLISALGIGTVFFGLILCIVFIKIFGAIAARITWTGAHSPAAASPAPEPVAEPLPEPVHEPVPPEIQAVIATVLDIEQRLYTGRTQQRLTLRRHDT